MPELDHLIFASPDLDDGVAHIASLSGVEPVPGGPHPKMGSRNALLTFDQTTYFEVIAVDPDQPAPAQPRPFGLDDGLGMRLAGYAIHPSPGESADEVVAAMQALGHDPGSLTSMSRVKPDGTEISWSLTRGDVASRAGGFLPFIIDWGSTPTPALSQPTLGSLDRLLIRHPDPAIRAVVEGLDLGVVVEEGEGRLEATITSPKGTFVLAS